MANPNSANEDIGFGNMSPDDMPHMGGGDGEDLELDNRIKELLLSTHNLYLITQIHEKEISELGPVIKEMPQLISSVIRSIGESGGAVTDGGGSSTGLSLPLLIAAAGGVSILTTVLTVIAILAFVV